MVPKWFLLLLSSICVTAQDFNITVPLNETITYENRELYGSFIALPKLATIKFDFTDVNKNLSFIIFQVHSHLYNVTLYNNTLGHNNVVIGTNNGLYSSTKTKLGTFYVYNHNEVDLRLYVSVHGYTYADPIPGGCNMEFIVPIAPYMAVTFNRDFIFVDAPPPSLNETISCNFSYVTNVTFYILYISEQTYDQDEYFDGIRNMMTLDKIRNYGKEISQNQWRVRRMLSAYPGTGAVYVAVVQIPEAGYSVYTPSFSYACSPLTPESCHLLGDVLSQIICSSLLFIGCFICYLGHRFFKTETFLFGMLSGVIVTYIILCCIANLSHISLLLASLISGLFFGSIWLIFWWFYGLPLFTVCLTTLNLGFLVASILYYRIPENITLLNTDSNFWCLFIVVVMLTSLIFLLATHLSNILCCAVLGAYAVVYSIDFYLGSNLKYVIINVVRRAVVPKFNNAAIVPPFLSKDAIVTGLWIFLSVTGFLFQHYHNRRRPPFPPIPRSATTMAPPGLIYGTFNANTNRNNRARAANVPDDARTPLLVA